MVVDKHKYLDLLDYVCNLVDDGNNVYMCAYVCKKCNKALLKMYTCGSAIQVVKADLCDHFKTYTIGNYCFANPDDDACRCRDIINNALVTVVDGTDVYLIVPKP